MGYGMNSVFKADVPGYELHAKGNVGVAVGFNKRPQRF